MAEYQKKKSPQPPDTASAICLRPFAGCHTGQPISVLREDFKPLRNNGLICAPDELARPELAAAIRGRRCPVVAQVYVDKWRGLKKGAIVALDGIDFFINENVGNVTRALETAVAAVAEASKNVPSSTKKAAEPLRAAEPLKAAEPLDEDDNFGFQTAPDKKKTRR